jgi:hypothetical protein
MKLARVKIHEQICSRSGQLLSATERLLCCVRAGHKEPERKNCTIRSREGVCQCQFYWSYPFASAARVDALEKHEVRADGRLIGANFLSDCFFSHKDDALRPGTETESSQGSSRTVAVRIIKLPP